MPNGNTPNTVTIENAELVFLNFSGRAGKYNREGERSFAVLLPENVAVQMLEDGWNVKRLKPGEDDERTEGTPYIHVKVRFDRKPPKIMIITSRGRTPWGEDEAPMLDWAEFKTVDLILSPYRWEAMGDTGVTAYLKTMFATLVEDDLDLKYADVPMAHGAVKIEGGEDGDR